MSRVTEALCLDGVLRIKGVVEIDGKDARHVIQGVGPRVDGFYDRPWSAEETRQSRLVVIGLKGIDPTAIETVLRAKLAHALARHSAWRDQRWHRSRRSRSVGG